MLLGAGDKKASPPTIEYPNRHLIFQVGQTGRKPWALKAAYQTQAHFMSAVFNPLLKFDRNYKVSPAIFSDWNWDKESNSYIFEIDRSYTFENYRPIEAKDIEFSILKNFLSSLENTDKRMFADIKDLEKLKPGMKYRSGMSKGIRILSETKIQIFLKQNNPSFLYVLGDLSTFIAPREDFADDMFTFKEIPRGTGPYKIEWSDPKSSLIRLKRKVIDEGALKAKYPLSIDFIDHGTALENNVDLAASAGANGLENNPEYSFTANAIPSLVQVIDFNYKNKYSNNILFREAVSLALNREEIFKTYNLLKMSHELVPEGYYGRTGKKFSHDPQKAAQIIKDNFPELSKGEPLTFVFHGAPKQDWIPAYAKEIRQQLKDVGINIKFESRDYISFNKEPARVAMGSYGSITSFVDPLAPFLIYTTDNSGFEAHTDLLDKKGQRLYLSASRAVDRASRAKIVQELGQHLQDQYRVLPLIQRGAYFAYKNTVENLDTTDSFFSINYDRLALRKGGK